MSTAEHDLVSYRGPRGIEWIQLTRTAFGRVWVRIDRIDSVEERMTNAGDIKGAIVRMRKRAYEVTQTADEVVKALNRP